MTRNFYTLFLFIFCCSFTALAYSNNKIENSKEDDFDVNETIMHHIKDSHDFHILDWNGHPVSVPLPVILWTNEGLVAFMSSEFHHDDSGATVVKRKNQAFVKFHEEIYYAGNDKEGKYIQLDSSNHPINDKPLDLSITSFSLDFASPDRCDLPVLAFFKFSIFQPGLFAQGPLEKFGFSGFIIGFSIF